MPFWLFKQEPSSYNYSQLEMDGKTVWNGVSNNLALKYLRMVRGGDKILFYHSGDEKQIVGIMRADSDPYPDPKEILARRVVLEVVPEKRLPVPVTLKAIKQDSSFSNWELVRISRLSVMPTPESIWNKVISLATAR